MEPPVTWEPLLWILVALGLLSLGFACTAIVSAYRFRRHVLASRVWDRSAFAPRVLVLVPCRGADPDLGKNLDAVLAQEHAAYRVVFCVDRLDDGAVAVIEAARARTRVPTGIAVASDIPELGGKGLALLGGLATRRSPDEVVVFLDSDIRPHPGFLRDLVQPLALPSVGATTGDRWDVPVHGGVWAVVPSASNIACLDIFF